MNDLTPPPLPESPEAGSTLFGRLTGIFVAPGEVVDGLKTARRCHWNWAVPMVLWMISAVIYVMVAYSQSSIIHDIRANAEKEIQKQIDAGKLPEKKGQEIIDGMEQFMTPTIFKIFGAVSAVVVAAAMTFVGALVVWLIGTKYFKAGFGYGQALEAVGLAAMINVLGAVIGMLLVIIKGNMLATAGPALFIDDLNYANPSHLVLSALNLPEIWFLSVASVALSRLGNTSFAKAAVWLFGIWAAMRFLPILSVLMRKG